MQLEHASDPILLVQVSNVGSESLTDAIALQLSKIANEALCSPNSTYDAVVITHVRSFAFPPSPYSSMTEHLFRRVPTPSRRLHSSSMPP